jgi:hypothetical protein
MNSLNDLNNYQVEVTYDDERDPLVAFDRLTPVNQTISIFEGQTSAAKVGIEILDIAGYEVALVNYTIDVSSVPGTTVTWPTIPSGCVVSNPSPGVYRLDGISSAGDWLVVRAPIIAQPVDYFGTLVYSSNINYFGNQNKSWNTTVTITDVLEWNLTTIADFWFPSTLIRSITIFPQLTDADNPVVSNIVSVIPNRPDLVTTLESTYVGGGSTSFNSVTKTLTIQGTNVQINNHLANLRYIGPTTVDEHFTITYRATNILFGYSDALVQNMRSSLIRYLSQVRSNLTYAEDDVEFSLSSSTPLITNIENVDGTGTYTVTVTPDQTNAIFNLSSTGTGGSSSFNSSTKVLTITGTRAQVNSRLNSILFTVRPDFTNNFTLTYAVTTPLSFTQSKVQLFTNTAVHDEVTNVIGITRNFEYEETNLLWPTQTPIITDLDVISTSYVIQLNCTFGVFSAPGTTTSKTWSYTGTKAQVNAIFSSISFTPDNTVFASGTFTYTQLKPGIPGTQVSATVTLQGPGARFNRVNPLPQSVNLIEGQTHSVPLGIDVTGVEDTITYTIDVSQSPGATVTWASVPAGCVVTNPSAGVYVMSGINTLAKWTTVKQPTVGLRNDYFGTFLYSANINWRTTRNKVWDTTVAVSNVEALTQVTSFNFFAGQSQSLTGFPTLVDTGNVTPTWTVTLTPSLVDKISTISAAGTGGTVSFNNSTKVFTITGTVSQVNSRLSNITVTTSPLAEANFNILYNASNNLTTETETRVQDFIKQTDFTFNPDNPVNQTVSVIEGQDHTVKTGTEITFLNTSYTRLRYIVNVSLVTGAIVTWPTIPSGCVVTNPSSGVYQITNVSTLAIWNAVKNPVVSLRNDVFGSFTYSATLTDDVIVKSWNTALSISDVDALSATTAANYFSGNTQTLTGTPTVVDQGYQNPEFTLTITPASSVHLPAISNMSSTGTGGVSAFNPVSKVLTIVGTKDQVNSHLGAVLLSSVLGKDLTYNVNYNLSNSSNSETASKTQKLSSNNFAVLNPVGGDETYTLNTAVTTTFAPNITDTGSSTIFGYNYAIAAVPTDAVSNIQVPAFTQWSTSFQSQLAFQSTSSSWVYRPGYVRISDDGLTAIVKPINGSGPIRSVRIFTRSGNTWSLLDTLDGPLFTNGFGGFFEPRGIAISGDGNTIAIENGRATETTFLSEIYVYKRLNGFFIQEAVLTPGPDNKTYNFGAAIALSYNGDRLIAGEPGVQNPRDDFPNGRKGYVYVYNRSGSTWTQEGRISPTGIEDNTYGFGLSLDISSDGNTMVVSGYVYSKASGSWVLQAATLSGFIDARDSFNRYVTLSPDGNLCAANNRLYSRTGSTWTLQHTFSAGSAFKLANNGNRAIGITFNDTNSIEIRDMIDFRKENGSWVQYPNIPLTSVLDTGGAISLKNELFDISENSEVLVYMELNNTVETVYFMLPRTSSYNSTTKTLTITADKTFINSINNSVTITPATGYAQDFEINYTATTPTGAVSTRNQYIRKI